MRTGFRRTDGRSSTARGYGADWRRLRERRLQAEPLCRFCAAEGRVTAATDVDHIKPFDGLTDPLRLDFENTRSLCRPCHMRRTQRQAVGSDAEPAVKGSTADGSPADPTHPWNR